MSNENYSNFDEKKNNKQTCILSSNEEKVFWKRPRKPLRRKLVKLFVNSVNLFVNEL